VGKHEHPEALESSTLTVDWTTRKSPDVRRAALARQAHVLITRGRRIESQSDFAAVLTRGRYVALRELLTIDQWGNASVEKLPLDWQRIIVAAGLALVILTVILISALTG
jgi:hypothetical protein